MGSIARVVKALFQRVGRAPGKSIAVQTQAAFSQERISELWMLPGIAAKPTKADRVLEQQLDGGGRVAIATKNYTVEVDPASGEVTIYSTNSDGDTVQATITLLADGNIDLNGNGRTLVTHAELNTALQTMLGTINTELGTKTDGSGTPGSAVLDISAAEAATLRTGT